MTFAYHDEFFFVVISDRDLKPHFATKEVYGWRPLDVEKDREMADPGFRTCLNRFWDTAQKAIKAEMDAVKKISISGAKTNTETDEIQEPTSPR